MPETTDACVGRSGLAGEGMKNEWKVSTNNIGDLKLYRVYRLKNSNEPDHSGNREYYGAYYRTMADADKLAERANSEDLNK